MQKITPFLWFDGRAEEAMNFYTSIFKNSKIISSKKWGKGTSFPEDQIMTGTFELDGLQFHAFDAGPEFKFTEAISLMIDCQDQEEVDYYWEKLQADGGQESVCGWLKDKFGVSWQVTPSILPKMLADTDREKAGRAMQAMMKMRKIEISVLEDAFNGK
jgi:predicted 3-demethylubiquinone-9 3-methyltransferase (glyoxalase superfamily)